MFGCIKTSQNSIRFGCILFKAIFWVAADWKPSKIAQFWAHFSPYGPQNRKVHTWASFQRDLSDFVSVRYFRVIPNRKYRNTEISVFSVRSHTEWNQGKSMTQVRCYYPFGNVSMAMAYLVIILRRKNTTSCFWAN